MATRRAYACIKCCEDVVQRQRVEVRIVQLLITSWLLTKEEMAEACARFRVLKSIPARPTDTRLVLYRALS